jgi:hypothetical protein
MSRLPGVTRINAPEDVAGVLTLAVAKKAITASEDEAIKLLQDLYATSYPGILYEPLTQSAMLTNENLSVIAESFSKVIKVL